jgi:hypothetical protein
MLRVLKGRGSSFTKVGALMIGPALAPAGGNPVLSNTALDEKLAAKGKGRPE